MYPWSKDPRGVTSPFHDVAMVTKSHFLQILEDKATLEASRKIRINHHEQEL